MRRLLYLPLGLWWLKASSARCRSPSLNVRLIPPPGVLAPDITEPARLRTLRTSGLWVASLANAHSRCYRTSIKDSQGVAIFLIFGPHARPRLALVIARLQRLHLLRKRSNITRRHRTVAEARAAGSREGHPIRASSEIVKVIFLAKRIRICAAKGKLAGLGVLDTKVLPVEEGGKALNTVTLVDALSSGLRAEADHLLCELLYRVFERLHAPIHNVDTLILYGDDRESGV